MIARECKTLLQQHLANRSCDHGQVLQFVTEEDNVDVYNITAPFSWQGRTLLFGRVEPRDSELSHILCFQPEGETWVRCRDFSPIALQDPFYTVIDGELILGGVEVFYAHEGDKNLSWRTVFYRGRTLSGLRRFSQGPEMMKDIRLRALPDGRILVLTRPNGKIGCAVLDSLDQLNAETLEKAPLLEDHFVDGQWGGGNELHILKNGSVGVLSHIACFDGQGNRHYYSSVFCLEPNTRVCTPMEMIACRDDFLPGPAKRPDLIDVIFSGGLVRNPDGTATLYCGVSDAGAQSLRIPDPFLKMEQQKTAGEKDAD